MVEDIMKILLAIIIGGLIGMERENVHRPAGFRTHILVCLGATLVMMTAEYINTIYYNGKTGDIARLGAQVISGIGFLGAGTIIKDGSTVKGLTTAATLWSVSCIGLAIGIGYYKGAIITALAVYSTLIILKRFELKYMSKVIIKCLNIEARNVDMVIKKVSKVFEIFSIRIKEIKLKEKIEDVQKISYVLLIPSDTDINNLLSELYVIEGIEHVFFE